MAAVLCLAGLGLGLWRFGAARGQEKKPDPKAAIPAPLNELAVVEEVRTSTELGLKYLRSKQKPDGSWSPNNNAINALALLAFMGRGHTPGRGPHKDVLEKGKKFLLAHARADGFLGFSSMYEHGLATLCLAEMYGMDPDPELEKTLRKAVELIIKCQSPAGGWRYQPQPGDQDLSVTVMQIVALRAANNAEIPVPDETIKKAIHYVRSCSSPAGGFGYQGPGQGPHTTAAGILSLQLLGQYNDPTIPKALDFLAKCPVNWECQGYYFFYFHYYAIQANYQAGGKYWNDWHGRVRELLLKHQYRLDAVHKDRTLEGSFELPPHSSEVPAVDKDRIYSTAMSCMVLDIYMHFLPAYQR